MNLRERHSCSPKKCGMIYLGSIKPLAMLGLKECQDFILVVIPPAKEDKKRERKRKTWVRRKYKSEATYTVLVLCVSAQEVMGCCFSGTGLGGCTWWVNLNFEAGRNGSQEVVEKSKITSATAVPQSFLIPCPSLSLGCVPCLWILATCPWCWHTLEHP